MKIETDNFLFLAERDTDSEPRTNNYDNDRENTDIFLQSDSNSVKDATTAQQPVQEISVTKKDFELYKKKIDDSIASVQAQAESATDPVGSVVGYISIAAIFLSVVACVIFIAMRSKLFERINDLTKTVSAQHSEIVKLSSEVAELTNAVGILKNKISTARQVEEDFELPTVRKIVGDYPATEKFNSQPRPVTQADKFSNFVQEFNSLAGQTGYDARKATDEFVKKFNIQAFNCTNFEARMSDPVPPPVFGSSTSLQNADYWAYEFENGVFAVVPRVKNYTDNHHTARAMGEIFKSNFRQGGTYNRIIVTKPAIFKGNWNLETQGEMQLG